MKERTKIQIARLCLFAVACVRDSESAQAARYSLLTRWSRFSLRVISREICGGRRGTRPRFPPTSFIFSC
jgi:hypothetical protein